MFVELIDHLRCPSPHEEIWLVMAADETRDRHVIRGSLGCPICLQRYVVAGGTVFFTSAGAGAPPSPAQARRGAASTATGTDADWPLRLAAFLGLADGGGAVGLYGRWANYAEGLGDVVERVEPVAIAPEEPTHPMLSAIVPPARAQVPLAAGVLRGVAVDRGDTPEQAEATVVEAARLVRPGGRLLAPADVPVPRGVRELARDAEWWVGEREGGVSGVVALGRRQ